MQSGVVVLTCSSSILGVETKGSVIKGYSQIHSKFHTSMKYKHKTLLEKKQCNDSLCWCWLLDTHFLSLPVPLVLTSGKKKKIPAPVTRYDDEGMTYLEDSSLLYGDSKFSLLGPTKYIDLHLDVVPLILQPVVMRQAGHVPPPS